MLFNPFHETIPAQPHRSSSPRASSHAHHAHAQYLPPEQYPEPPLPPFPQPFRKPVDCPISAQLSICATFPAVLDALTLATLPGGAAALHSPLASSQNQSPD